MSEQHSQVFYNNNNNSNKKEAVGELYVELTRKIDTQAILIITIII